VTELLPHALREAVERKSVFAASTSFGLVALFLLIALLIAWDGLGVRPGSRRPVGFGALVLPLLVVVLLTMVARVARLVH
jgi:hypothetical protein